MSEPKHGDITQQGFVALEKQLPPPTQMYGNMRPKHVEHTPPKFLVRNPEWDTSTIECAQYFEFDNGADTVAKAEELSRANPGLFIDIYQHATALRKSAE